jgi:hypothetical protein
VTIASPPVTPAGCSLPVRGPLNLESLGLFAAAASEDSSSPRMVSAKSSDIPLPKPRPAAYRRAGAPSQALRERPAALETTEVRVQAAARCLVTLVVIAAAAVLALEPAIVAVPVLTGALGSGADRHASGALPPDLLRDAAVVCVLLTLVLAYKLWRTGEDIHED